ncbi:RbsD/FucU family protein [Bogoriella caseilytica]|uniref:L-fucose mutarotase n=1 Tax=Bogoriella caseilytica TaxID=56055 RepID=A0A3N2BAF7_9MICO|nr:RbsD/FucU family protein [Bogoriella caseilytica]ROR72253.1 L-fucose mutarotase [Bogoriella caseilytica]
MLKYDLTHPPLIAALASAGHGDRILIADGNFPSLAMTSPQARLIHLNLAPDLLTTTAVLRPILSAVNPESAVMMEARDPAPVQAELRGLLGAGVPVDHLGRFAFYDLAKSREVGVVIQTGDTRPYGNVVITIGMR